jgi:hypothetical protein
MILAMSPHVQAIESGAMNCFIGTDRKGNAPKLLVSAKIAHFSMPKECVV